jgi:hypothetical protein
LNCDKPGVVSTSDLTCGVFVGSESFDDWNDLADTHSDRRIASGKIPFVIADQPGEYILTDIVLRGSIRETAWLGPR